MIEKYQAGDAAKVWLQPEQENEAAEFAAFFDGIEAYALRQNGQVLAVFGWRAAEEGAAECFALIGRQAGRRLLEMKRFIDKRLPELMRREGIKVMRMTVRCGFAAGRRFAGLLGFVPVMVLPRFFENCDYQLFERKLTWL